MGPIERQWERDISRRRALAGLGGMLLGAPGILSAQVDPRGISEHRRAPSLNEMLEIYDFEPVCYANMPQRFYDYMAQAADGEWTKRRNRLVFDWVEERRASVELREEDVTISTEILGVEMRTPVVIAPTAFQGQLHPSAEVGMYEAASAAGALMAVSHNATLPQEEIAGTASGPRWIQIYPSRNEEVTQATLRRYEDAGAEAIVITVDQQASRYDRAVQNRWLGGNPGQGGAGGWIPDSAPSETGPARYGVGAGRLWYNWDFMERMREQVEVPVLIKGILTREDARISADRGFDGVIVSNHGARSLDYSPSTLEVLEEVVEEVGGEIAVLIDSGFRRGSDIFKALALGADAVCIGRAARWGLGAFGPEGAQRVLEILENELRASMARAGRGSVGAIDRTAVRTEFS